MPSVCAYMEQIEGDTSSRALNRFMICATPILINIKVEPFKFLRYNKIGKSVE